MEDAVRDVPADESTAEDRLHEVVAADDTGMIGQQVMIVHDDVERELEPEDGLEREAP
jgi:hypothetical protein